MKSEYVDKYGNILKENDIVLNGAGDKLKVVYERNEWFLQSLNTGRKFLLFMYTTIKNELVKPLDLPSGDEE